MQGNDYFKLRIHINQIIQFLLLFSSFIIVFFFFLYFRFGAAESIGLHLEGTDFQIASHFSLFLSIFHSPPSINSTEWFTRVFRGVDDVRIGKTEKQAILE